MNYSTLELAPILALPAGHRRHDAQLREAEVTDIQAECLTAGIADELDGDQMEAFVEQCLHDGGPPGQNPNGHKARWPAAT
jgi:hypothetical protein